MRRTALFGSAGRQILRGAADGFDRVLMRRSDQADRAGLDLAQRAVLAHLLDVNAELLP